MNCLYTYCLFVLLILLANIGLSGQVPTERFTKEGMSNLIPSKIIYPHNSSAKTLEVENQLLALKADYKLSNDVAWMDYDSIEYHYNNDNQLELMIFYDLRNNVLVKMYKHIYEYDFNGNLILMESRSWDDILIVNASRYSWSYDLNNKVISETQQLYKSDWRNFINQKFEYDELGNLSICIKQSWTDSGWYDSGRRIYKYDANNNRISELRQNIHLNSWNDYSKTIYKYDLNNKRTSMINMILQEDSWVNNQKVFYNYDFNGNLILEHELSWQDNRWENLNKYQYFYNPNNDIEKYSMYYWTSNMWRANHKRNISYYKNEKIIISGMWFGDLWVENSRRIYYYSKNFPRTNSIQGIEVFPNPSTGQFSIHLDEVEIINGLLEIFNSNGQLVHFQKIDLGIYQLNVNLENLSDGTYYMVLSDENTKIKQTLMLVR